ncbi:hypothetical protein [uncultured Jannaschia sp.]|uniref:hypothetical protein n=1 Tax=uncultured Jannaschia sp. TaxID=293347 RepID=UPI0026152E12|nr:hypothetical protein [uncultured Jannaschia sp.]
MRQRDRLVTYNERVKLMATTINAIGLAFVALGIVRPTVDPDLTIGLAGTVFGLIGLACHGAAHYILRYMEMKA